MFYKPINILLTLFSVFMIFGCKSEINSPDKLNADAIELYKFETIESDVDLLKNFGVPVIDSEGVFSIGWNEIFRPFDDDEHIKGMAFAVVFGDSIIQPNVFTNRGINMGKISIDYAGNQVRMHKMFNYRRGFAYSLFNRPFGDSDVLLEYIPHTEYTFNITGSDKFSPALITLTSPDSLIKITNLAFGSVVDTSQDLTINWSGGNPVGKVAIQIMALFNPHHGNHGHNKPFGDNEDPNLLPHPKNALVIILQNNPGTYTLTASQIQALISELNAEKLVVGVSQFDIGSVQHDEKTLHTAMRNSTSVMLKVE